MTNLTLAENLYQNRNTYGQIHPQRYTYSFSGADTKALVYFPQRPDLINYLDSVHTISISVHEAKSQVRSLGYRGIKGLTRSVRTIAGSMILTVMNDHPLRALMEQYSKMVSDLSEDGTYSPLPFGWSADRDELGVGTHQDIYNFQNRLSALLPPFNLILEFVAEMAPVTLDAATQGIDINTGKPQRTDSSTGKLQKNSSNRVLFPGAGLMLQEIEIIDEGFVVSVNDLVTEITLSYIAKDFKPISANTFHEGGSALTQTEIQNRQWELWKRCYPEKHQPREVVLLPGEELMRDWSSQNNGNF